MNKKRENKQNKRAQVTIFIILAILIISGVVAYFVLRKGINSGIPKNMQPVYDYYSSCLELTAKQGISLLGEQAGYIQTPEFIPGSQYMPFSSQLDFFGQPVPYWMYVSGNNLLKEQVPSKTGMEKELEDYIGARLNYCDFSDFELQGYDVYVEPEGSVDVKINNLDVEVNVNNDLVIAFDEESAIVKNHEFSIKSKLGKFYGLALDIYNFEKKNMFLEKYAVDVMRLYAPVDGVEISCSPQVFNEQEIKQELSQGLSANMGMLKLKGDYYELTDKQNEYFITDIGKNVNEQINFIYSPNWPTRIEMYGDNVIEPVGLQEGLGVLGFCYVPYHFVYDIDFPVLLQFYDNEELFQFPIAVIINKNQERNELPTIEGQSIESEVCRFKNKNIEVYTYDSELNPIPANINFKCLDSECLIGETSIQGNDAVLKTGAPACVNGFIVASSEGYVTSKYQMSTNEEKVANIIMKKLYDVPIEVNSGSSEVGRALVSFVSEDYSDTIVYPDSKSIKLTEGQYDVRVYIYKDQALTIPAISERKCVMVPKSGIAGVFGLEEEKCFDINIPSQTIEAAIIGGGKSPSYIPESELKTGKILSISAEVFNTPSTLEQVQEVYNNVEDSSLGIKFR